MLVKISDNTINLLKKEVLPKLRISLPIKLEDIDKIFEYLLDREVYLSQDIEDGIQHDSFYVNSISTAVDEFNIQDINTLDLNYINTKLN